MDQDPPAQELQLGGPVPLETGTYVARQSDQELLEALQAGEYCNVLCPRQMGKTSAILRIRAELRANKCRTALVDIAGRLGTPANADDWYVGLLGEISAQCKLACDIKAWWAAHPAPTANQKFLAFFRDEVLARHPGVRFVVFLDEIDHTLNLAYTDDFFLAIRSLYNDRASEPDLCRLAFCLVGVFTPNELVKQQRTTTYNVGRTFELQDFDLARDDLSPLARALSPNAAQGDALLKAVWRWTGGQPYLTVSACKKVAEAGATSPADVDRIIEESFLTHERPIEGTDGTHFENIARFLGERVSAKLETVNLYRRLLNGAKERERPTPPVLALKLSGLVKTGRDARLTIRNEIYRRRFDKKWAGTVVPLGPRVWNIAAFTTTTAAVLFGLVWFLWWQPYWDTENQARELAAFMDSAKNDIPLKQYEALKALPRHAQQAEEKWVHYWSRQAQRLKELSGSLGASGTSDASGNDEFGSLCRRLQEAPAEPAVIRLEIRAAADHGAAGLVDALRRPTKTTDLAELKRTVDGWDRISNAFESLTPLIEAGTCQRESRRIVEAIGDVSLTESDRWLEAILQEAARKRSGGEAQPPAIASARLNALTVALGSLSAKLDAKDVPPLATTLVERMKGEQDSAALARLGDALGSLSAKLDAKDVQPLATALVERMKGEQDSAALSNLGDALGSLSAKLDAKDVPPVATTLVERMKGEQDSAALARLGDALGSLSAKLDAKDVQPRAAALVERMKGEQDSAALSDLGDALGRLSAKLDAKDVQPGAAALVERMKGEQHSAALSRLGDALGSLSAKLDAKDVQPGAAALVERMKGEQDSAALSRLGDALGSLSAKLDAKDVQPGAAALVERMKGEKDSDALSSLGDALGSLSAKLDAKDVQPGAAALVERMKSEKDSDALSRLGDALGSLSAKLDAKDVQPGAAALVERMKSEKDSDALSRLGDALGSLSAKLDAKDVQPGAAALVERMKSEKDSDALSSLGDALGSLSAKLDAKDVQPGPRRWSSA